MIIEADKTQQAISDLKTQCAMAGNSVLLLYGRRLVAYSKLSGASKPVPRMKFKFPNMISKNTVEQIQEISRSLSKSQRCMLHLSMG